MNRILMSLLLVAGFTLASCTKKEVALPRNVPLGSHEGRQIAVRALEAGSNSITVAGKTYTVRFDSQGNAKEIKQIK